MIADDHKQLKKILKAVNRDSRVPETDTGTKAVEMLVREAQDPELEYLGGTVVRQQELKKYRGAQFDPEIVDVFLGSKLLS